MKVIEYIERRVSRAVVWRVLMAVGTGVAGLLGYLLLAVLS